MTISAYPVQLAIDATALIKLVGPPDKAVYWSLSGSNGTITPVNVFTDSRGRAAAIFKPADGQLSTAISLASPSVHYKLDEAEGTVMTDSVGALNGAYGGSPILGTPALVYGEGTSVSFPTNQQYCMTNNTGVMSTLHEGNYSIHTWFVLHSQPTAWNERDATASYGLVVKPRWHSTGEHYHFCIRVNRSLQLISEHFLTGNAQVIATSAPNTVDVGTVYSATMTVSKDNGEMFLYLNGTQVASDTFTPGATAKAETSAWRLAIARETAPTGWYAWPLDGKLQMTSFYNRALTPVEVLGIYNARPELQIGNAATIYATYGA